MSSSIELEVRCHREGATWRYRDLDQRQREIAARIAAGGPGALLLSEVAPVITLGRRAGEGELRMPEAFLQSQGIDIFPVDRGGLATYHGPGQWVLFAVDRLDRLTGDPRGVRKAVEGLLESALATARLYDPQAEIRSGIETGVWTPRGKVGAVGVHIENGILLHGLALNGYRTPTSFLGLRPCGLDAPVDFLLEGRSESPRDEATRSQAFDRLGQELARAATERFWQKNFAD